MTTKKKIAKKNKSVYNKKVNKENENQEESLGGNLNQDLPPRGNPVMEPAPKSGNPKSSEPANSKKLGKALIKKTSKDQDDYEKLLGTVPEINPEDTEGDTDIFIRGIDSRRKDHPVILKCPLEFRWRKKENNIPDGKGGFINRRWRVVSKKLVKNKDGTSWLTVNNDDSPDSDRFTVGDLNLCCTDKKNFKDRKRERTIGNILRPKKIKEERNEFAKAQTYRENLDGYDARNTKESATMQSKFKVKPGESDEEAYARAKAIAEESDF